jgi:DNA-binding MarR family transcriptional regulator
MKASAERGRPKHDPDIASIREQLRYNVESFHNGDSSSIDIVLTLRITNLVLQDLIDGYARPYRLSAARSNVLFALYSAKNHTMPAHGLADALYNTRGNVTWLVDSLVEAGLVETNESQTDRRSKNVSLTRAGLALLKSFAPRHYGALDATTSILTRAERKQLLQLLDKVRDRALEVAPQIVAGASAVREKPRRRTGSAI